jgi:uncharacterized protein
MEEQMYFETPLDAAQEFLSRLSAGDPDDVAAMFHPDLDFSIPGDEGALPWIGRRRGRAAMAAFIRAAPQLVERLRFDVKDVLVGETRAAIYGALASRSLNTGRVVEQDFVFILTLSGGEVRAFEMLEDSFAVSRAARC